MGKFRSKRSYFEQNPVQFGQKWVFFTKWTIEKINNQDKKGGNFGQC